ncbi:hypothetical protein P3W85_04535 [Cupriavidus basilensis]|uniref:Uncharacterized protein n=1 Tax=Cupriavidus basilensis TaxID=68895 RepID=A0ABT6AHZ1_9BURK|nr:hypothetical protein [Cupriavidus basilensis]MDF3832221.1 hypothetical protein [Cupriavidus basilensis]
MKARYRITCLLGAGAVLALGFAAGLMTAWPPAREDGAGERASAAAATATEIRVAADAALSYCDDACRQSRGIAAVTAMGHRPPP